VTQHADQNGVPLGWDYNPSTWEQRTPIILLALVAFVIAGYLAVYQLEIITSVWEPLFGDGSEVILNSSVSHALPIPDALLGAFGYLADAVAGVVGGKDRWRKMPWIVVLFGIAVGPLGVVSITLVIFQPVLFDAWCTLCLSTAVISLLMIGPAADEVLASLQYLKRRRAEGASLWRSFWGLDGAPAVTSRSHAHSGGRA
jgi:uncharacterized membrane protein